MQEIQALTKVASVLQWLVIIFLFLAGTLLLTKLAIDKKIEAAREETTGAKMEEYEQVIAALQEKATELKQLKGAIQQKFERTIPSQFLPQMEQELSKYKGSSVRLACNTEDTEALALAEQLKEVFQGSGWKVIGVEHTVLSRPVKNIVIILNSEEQKPKAKPEDIGIIVGQKE
jgi:hypothetical protein